MHTRFRDPRYSPTNERPNLVEVQHRKSFLLRLTAGGPLRAEGISLKALRYLYKCTGIEIPARQRQVYEFIRKFSQNHGCGPTYRQIQSAFRFASVNSAQEHVRSLRKRGLLRPRSDAARNIQPASLGGIPIFGTIPAGIPIDTVADSEDEIPISAEMFGRRPGTKLFGLRVSGQSMVKAGVHDKDTVILEHRAPQDGEIVAALVDQRSTLKRFVIRDGQPWLKAESNDFSDLRPAQDLVIQGVMVGLFRRGSR